MSNEEHLVREELQTSSPALQSRFTALREDAAHVEDPTMRNSLIARAMTAPTMRKSIYLTTTIMITASLAAVAFLMVHFLGSSNSVRQPKRVEESTVTTINIDTVVAPKAPSMPHSRIVEAQTHSGVIYQTNAVSRDSDAYRPVNVEGINPIVIPTSRLKAFGIKCDSIGVIHYYNRAAFSQQVESHSLGLNGAISSGFSVKDTSGIQVMKQAPRMITDLSGKLHFLRFEIRNFSKPSVRELLEMNDSSSSESGTAEVIFSQHGPHVTVQQPLDSSRGSRGGTKQPSLQTVDRQRSASILEGQAEVRTMNDGSVSITPQPERRASSSSGTFLTTEDARLSIMTNSQPNSGSLPLLKPHSDEARWDSLFATVIVDVRHEQPDVNHLIPVLVRNTKGSVLNEVIMWYDPSPELTAILPEVTQSSSVAPKNPPGALKELTISPNPAGNSATIHYTLSEERNVRFTLYTLVGERVLQITSSERHSGGSGTVPVDLATVRTGVYLLVAVTDKGEQLTQRLVVEK